MIQCALEATMDLHDHHLDALLWQLNRDILAGDALGHASFHGAVATLTDEARRRGIDLTEYTAIRDYLETHGLSAHAVNPGMPAGYR